MKGENAKVDGYQIQQMQLQRAIGELRALVSLYYDPMRGKTEEYKEIRDMVEIFIGDLKSNFG